METEFRQDWLSISSPAKLNLQLRILGRRPDGFHELETLMVRIGWYDTLHLRERADRQVKLRIRKSHYDFGDVPAGPTNLVWRAAERLREAAGCRRGVDLVIEKRIPSEAGLAGGSGNAAATLIALNQLWGLNWPSEQLGELATTLGSDLSFFLIPEPAAIARGRGERLQPVRLPGRLYFVIVKPPFGLSTVAVYDAYARSRARYSTPGCEAFAMKLCSGGPKDFGDGLTNDLAAAAEALFPQLQHVKNLVAAVCTRGALMTGSGSAVFGVCESAREADVAAGRLRSLVLGRVKATMSV